jgi:hypothetical protein
MSLFHLNKFVTGNEDFADAHEPLNDGVKEVPNAQTVAASTKTGDVGTDTNSQGPAKVIPEKEDTDDVTEKQFDTVKESAEGGSESTPAKPAGETSESKPTPPPAKPAESAEGSETDSSDGTTKPPPFVKKDDAEDSEVEADEPKLEHDTAEATDSEIKKTEAATNSLEDYAKFAGRYDIIGYPRRDQDRLRNTIGFINRRAGKSGTVTKLSLECISEAVTTGKARLENLRAQASLHAARKVSSENYGAVVDHAVCGEPTAHGNPPLEPIVAEQLTEVETDAMDLPEIAEIGRIQEAVQTLQGAGVAIEQHLAILRSNKRVSKQAAAVLQAGLEHIDHICGLKVRATGMEGYLTTPRAACEEADINEKSLTDRAGEIGAKIMHFVRKLISMAEEIWSKYQTGVEATRKRLEALEAKIKDVTDEGSGQKIVLNNPSEFMFIRDEFVGLETPVETLQAFELIHRSYIEADRGIVSTMLADCRHADDVQDLVGHIEMRLDRFKRAREVQNLVVPGNYIVRAVGPILSLGKAEDAPETPNSVEFDADLSIIKTNLRGIHKFLDNLNHGDTINLLKKKSNDTVKVIVDTRKRLGGEFDEIEFQKFQTRVIEVLNEVFDLKVYFKAMGVFAKIAQAQLNVAEAVLAAHTKSSSKE